jgi:hypothetical protein
VWEVISRQYAQYHKDVLEEWQVMNTCLGSAQLGLILGCFSNLLDFKIVKGTFSLTDNGKFSLSDNEIIKENLDGINSIPVSSGLDLRTRGEGLWQGCVPSRAASYLAFRTSMTIFAQNPNKIKELEINHLPWQLLQRSSFLRPLLKAHTDSWALTRLCLTVPFHMSCYWNYEDIDLCQKTMSHGLLRQFITNLPKPVDLSMVFPCVNEECHRATKLSDVLPSTILNLQKLRLEYFETSETFFTHILHANAPTIQVLDLADMYLDPQGSWIRIFKFLRRNQEQLSSAKISGEFGDSITFFSDPPLYHDPVLIYSLDDVWMFHTLPIVARRLERYLIHGGPCPLLHSDKQGVMLGLIDADHQRPRTTVIKRRMSASQAKSGRSHLIDSRASANSRTRRGSAGF